LKKTVRSEIDGIPERLRSFGVRPLTHRVDVYRYLIEQNNHPTADMIHNDLVKILPSLSKTTVYNVLNHLCEKGAVHRVNVEQHEARYDAMIHDHVHFKCRLCGKVYDLDEIPFPTIDPPTDYSIEIVQVIIGGICPDCQTG